MLQHTASRQTSLPKTLKHSNSYEWPGIYKAIENESYENNASPIENNGNYEHAENTKQLPQLQTQQYYLQRHRLAQVLKNMQLCDVWWQVRSRRALGVV